MSTRRFVPPELVPPPSISESVPASEDTLQSGEVRVADERHEATETRAKSDVGPTRRRRTGRRIPVHAHSDMLRAAALLPIDDGAESVARAVADVMRASLPSCAVGVVLPHEGAAGDPLYVTAAPLVPTVASATPQPITPSHARETDPSRLFPWLDDELIVQLPAPFEGVSLHVAGEIDVDGEVDARVHEAMDRGALLLASALGAVQRMRAQRGNATELRDLQARVVQSEKLASVGQIAAKVAHELNNPLTAIVSYSDFLTKKLEACGHDVADVERLRRIGESAQRILRFSRELTAYARPADESAPVSIREIVERSIVFCEHVIAPLSISVHARIDANTPTVVGRKGQLTQVLVNLITNACHAIQDAQREEAGEIVITSCARDDGGVTLTVGDNGLGISPQNLVRVFDPFFTTKATGRGTGLGLSIVRSIVEDHGGRVWARSVVGSGTQFVVELPPARG